MKNSCSLPFWTPISFTHTEKTSPTEFQSLAENYGLHFDLSRLKTELTVMYNMTNFEARSPSDLLRFLTLKELTESIPQLCHVTCLVLTIPVSTSSVGWSYSALKRIKMHVRNQGWPKPLWGLKQNLFGGPSASAIFFS